MTPPPNGNLPIIHNIRILHKHLYVIGQKLPKRNKLGIHAKIEETCLEILSLAIESAFTTRILKKTSLESLRIRIGLLQNLIRTENELRIIEEKTYLHLSGQIVEISKMANGWFNYINAKGA